MHCYLPVVTHLRNISLFERNFVFVCLIPYISASLSHNDIHLSTRALPTIFSFQLYDWHILDAFHLKATKTIIALNYMTKYLLQSLLTHRIVLYKRDLIRTPMANETECMKTAPNPYRPPNKGVNTPPASLQAPPASSSPLRWASRRPHPSLKGRVLLGPVARVINKLT